MFRNPMCPTLFDFGKSWFLDKQDESDPIPKKQQFSLNDEAFIKMLVDDINSAYKSIKIVEGMENIELYNDERVIKAFKNAIKRNVKIQFVLKPAIQIG